MTWYRYDVKALSMCLAVDRLVSRLDSDPVSFSLSSQGLVQARRTSSKTHGDAIRDDLGSLMFPARPEVFAAPIYTFFSSNEFQPIKLLQRTPANMQHQPTELFQCMSTDRLAGWSSVHLAVVVRKLQPFMRTYDLPSPTADFLVAALQSAVPSLRHWQISLQRLATLYVRMGAVTGLATLDLASGDRLRCRPPDR